MGKQLIITICFLLQFYSMNSQEKNTWALGGGISNFIMHGDLRSIGTGEQGNFWNLGGYLYADKMFSSKFGLEFKLNYNRISGGAQYFSDVYDILYVSNTNITDDLFFEGRSYGLELNMIISISNLMLKGPEKWHVGAYIGVGYQQYNSELFRRNIDGTTTSLIDFGLNPARDNIREASSIFISTQIGVKYRLNRRIDLEFRPSWYFNYEDHLDATISRKQDWETFFVNHLGIIFKLGNKKEYIIWGKDTSRPPVEIKLPKHTDSDKDGVMDEFDVEPGTPEGVMVYGNGKAIDSDKDKLPDYKDKCPLKPGPIENKGCPLLKDTDKDGVYDFEDLCPLEPGPKENKGCPLPEKQEPESVTIIKYISELAANVYFDTAKWTIKSESIEVLDKIASYLERVPDIQFKIEGHTDNRATDRYNLFLSQKRADAVFKYLLRKGIKRARLSFVGYGESRPKYSNETPEGRQLNRRVEIKPLNELEVNPIKDKE